MNRVLVTACLTLSLLTGLASAGQSECRDDYIRRPELGSDLRLEASWWYTDGEAGFELGDFFGTFSDIEYPFDGGMLEGRAEYRYYFPFFDLLGGIGLRGRYAESLDLEGTSTDEDFTLGFTSHYSSSETETEATAWDVDLLLIAYPLIMMESKALQSIQFALIVGTGEHRFEMETEDLDYRYDYGTIVGSEEGPVSTYDLEFTGMRVGVQASIQPVQKLTLTVEAVAIPSLEAESDALWILRDYPFQQRAKGSGSIVAFTANYALFDHMDIFLRLRSAELIADEDGKEDGVMDGVEAYEDEGIVEELTAEYIGGEVGVALTF